MVKAAFWFGDICVGETMGQFLVEYLPSSEDEYESLVHVSSRFSLNLVRVQRLLRVTIKLQLTQDQEEFEQAYLDDTLRAAVVFLHATLEDALREILRLKLGKCSAKVLDDIPLVGISSTGQSQKFFLGKLSEHRGKTIDALIQESVDQFLGRTTFNSSSDIASWFEKLGFDLSGLRRYFTNLDRMISRRHQIVHRADQESGPEDQKLASIDVFSVTEWLGTVGAFLWEAFLLGYPPDFQIRLREDPQSKKLLASLQELAGMGSGETTQGK